MALPDCERCDSAAQVSRFTFLDREDGHGDEWLCWECRWPFIKRRVHPPEPYDDDDHDSSGADTMSQASLQQFR